MKVAYYNIETNLVNSTVVGPELERMPEPNPGHVMVVTDYDGNLPALWDGSKVVELPPQPSEAHAWNGATRKWELDFSEAKGLAWQVVKSQRDAKEFGPFVWNVYTFDGDIDAQRRINLAVMGAQAALIAGQPWSMDWTLADNSVVTLSASEMVAVAQALGANIAAAHEEARLKRVAIEAATTVEELENI